MKLPSVIVFDLDGTIWAPEMYQLWGSGGPPFRAHDGGAFLTDRRGTRIELLGDSPAILESIISTPEYQNGHVSMAFASTCDEPEWARHCLSLFCLKGGAAPLGSVVRHHEIYQARDKTAHFQAIQKKTGTNYRDMIFFDNQMNNIRDVSALGVHCVFCPDGLTKELWRAGIEEWQRRG